MDSDNCWIVDFEKVLSPCPKRGEWMFKLIFYDLEVKLDAEDALRLFKQLEGAIRLARNRLRDLKEYTAEYQEYAAALASEIGDKKQ